MKYFLFFLGLILSQLSSAQSYQFERLYRQADTLVNDSLSFAEHIEAAGRCRKAALNWRLGSTGIALGFAVLANSTSSPHLYYVSGGVFLLGNVMALFRDYDAANHLIMAGEKGKNLKIQLRPTGVGLRYEF